MVSLPSTGPVTSIGPFPQGDGGARETFQKAGIGSLGGFLHHRCYADKAQAAKATQV